MRPHGRARTVAALLRRALRRKNCPLSDNSGQRWILARDGLSTHDPTATLRSGIAALPVGPMQRHSSRLIDLRHCAWERALLRAAWERRSQTMKLTLNHAIAAILLMLSLAAPVTAGPLENAISAHDEPFGLATVPVPQNAIGAHWRRVQKDWTVERGILERCRAERERCPSRAALQFLTVIDEARGQTGRARLGYINRAINLAIRPMNDLANYGVPEIWTAPLATLANGAGDCTDYAIAKYYALGEVGVPANDRRLVVVSIKSRRMDHAVLAVREDQRWLILDNRRMAIVDVADTTEYVPLLEFNHRGMRQFVKPALAEDTRVAAEPPD